MSRRLILHIVVAVLLWVLFGYHWGLVAQRRITRGTVDAVELLFLIAVGIWALTTLWIQHNRRRYAGRPDRRARRTASGEHPALADEDSIGFAVRVEGSPEDLHEAPYVEIAVDPEERSKLFRPAPIPEPVTDEKPSASADAAGAPPEDAPSKEVPVPDDGGAP